MRRNVRAKILFVWVIQVIAFSVLAIIGLAEILKPVHVAGPYIEHVSPPVVCRGRTNRIELFGRELDGAVDVWTSAPGVHLKATPLGTSNAQHAAFDVEVPADAPLGLYGLRVATRSGLSNVHIFLIDELPVQLRQAAPMKVTLPAAIHNNCRAATVDRYTIDVKDGQRVTFEVVGNRFGKDYDPLVTIRDADNRIVAQRDNDVGLFFDCLFQHTFERGGAYSVEVRDGRFAGDPTWHYVLRMGDFPVARVAVPSSVAPGQPSRLAFPQIPGANAVFSFPSDTPHGWLYGEARLTQSSLATWLPLHVDQYENCVESEPNDDRETATEAKFPSTLHGVLEKAGDYDWFKFEMEKGKTITVTSDARALGSPADLELVMYDTNGREIRRIDDVTIRDGQDTWTVDARFDISLRQEGAYYLRVGDLSHGGGPAFAYRVEVTESKPLLVIKSEVSRVTLPRETYQPIPLKITRTRFNGPIKLELRGAPAGVTLEPQTIPEKVTEIVCQLKANGTVPEGAATMQIVGRWQSDDPKNPQSAEALATTFPLIDRRVKDKDLRIYALRADQLCPPPSLINRIALLITPPAPFDVQLPQQQVLVTKYLDGDFPIATTRSDGFDAPVTFTAKGKEIGPESEERSKVYLRFPEARPDDLNVKGLIFNRILTPFGKFRVDLSATAPAGDRRVTLNRTFDLEVKPGFSPTPESAKIETIPGGTVKFRLMANRTPAFDGPVTLTATPLRGFRHPEKVTITAGQDSIDIEVAADADTRPGRHTLRFISRGYVGKYEEEVRGPNITIDLKKPPMEKK